MNRNSYVSVFNCSQVNSSEEAGSSPDKASEDHSATLKSDLSWVLFKRRMVPGTKFSTNSFFDPPTGNKLTENTLPGDYQCPYKDAVRILEEFRGCYDGVALVLTSKDPYNVTIIKKGGGLLGYPNNGFYYYEWDRMHDKVGEEVENILEEQDTYAFHMPDSWHVCTVGRASKAKNAKKRFKKTVENNIGQAELPIENHDGGGKKGEKEFAPKFIPFSDETVEGYNRPIRDTQPWVDRHIPKLGKKKDTDKRRRDEERACIDIFGAPEKKARIKTSSNLSENVSPIVSKMKCAIWKNENPRLKEVKEDFGGYSWKYERPPRSPKTKKRIPWGEENFERSKRSWGSYEEAHSALTKDESFQGITTLIEPDETFVVRGKTRYPIFLDFDNCRNPKTGELTPQVEKWMKSMRTYFEISPSGTGVHGIGFAKSHSDSKSTFWVGGQRVEVFGGNQGSRRTLAFTGVPVDGYDRPIRSIQAWIDKFIPLHPPKIPDAELEPSEQITIIHEEVARRIESSEDKDMMDRFVRGDSSLWQGENRRYGSKSQAEQGLFQKLAFYSGGNRKAIVTLARLTNMYNEKWKRNDILGKLISNAIEYCDGQFYDPHFSSKDKLLKQLEEVWKTLDDPNLRRPLGGLMVWLDDHGWHSKKGHPLEIGEEVITTPEDGLLVHAATRDIGPWLGENDTRNISRKMEYLTDNSPIKILWKGDWRKGSLYLIPSSISSKDFSKSNQNTTKSISTPSTNSTSSLSNTPSPIYSPCLYLICCMSASNEGVGREIYQQITWSRKSSKTKGKASAGLTNNQRLLLEVVLFSGITTLDDLAAFFGMRKNDFMSRVVKGVIVDLGLLEWDGKNLRPTADFIERLHSVFVDSGGEERLKKARAKFEDERLLGKIDGKCREKIEAEIQVLEKRPFPLECYATNSHFPAGGLALEHITSIHKAQTNLRDNLGSMVQEVREVVGTSTEQLAVDEVVAEVWSNRDERGKNSISKPDETWMRATKTHPRASVGNI